MAYLGPYAVLQQHLLYEYDHPRITRQLPFPLMGGGLGLLKCTPRSPLAAFAFALWLSLPLLLLPRVLEFRRHNTDQWPE